MENITILVEEMKKLGFSQYEAKAYLSLLQNWPCNGYVLGKESGVPRSKIYEVTSSLVKKQIIFEKKLEKGSVFIPLEPENLVSNIKASYNNIIDHVEKETTTLFSNKKNKFESKVICGRTNIFNFMTKMIKKAESRIDVSIWEEEYLDLSSIFEHSISRGVKVKGVYFGYNNKFAQVLTHRKIDAYLKEKSQRYIILVVDNKEAVTGIVSRGEESQVTWTNDPGVIDIVEDYIVHDLMINMFSGELQEDERVVFENKMEEVRKNFFDL